MIRLLISAAIHLAANAIGLLVASLVLPDMSIDVTAFIFAVLIFTVVEVVAGPLLTKIAITNVKALVGGVALVTTLVGLIATDLISDGMTISGIWTWILATLVVWLAGTLAGVLLPLVLVKKAVDAHAA